MNKQRINVYVDPMERKTNLTTLLSVLSGLLRYNEKRSNHRQSLDVFVPFHCRKTYLVGLEVVSPWMGQLTCWWNELEWALKNKIKHSAVFIIKALRDYLFY